MYVVSPEIRLDPEVLGVPFEPDDWHAHGQLLFHLPTHAAFVVLAPSHIKRGDRVSLFDIFARLVHVCDDSPVPLEITELGRAAIILYLMKTGQLQGWKLSEMRASHASSITPAGTCSPDENAG